MLANIQKWVINFALRIADRQNHAFSVSQPRYELTTLLEGITVDNLHGEVDTGNAVGNEGW